VAHALIPRPAASDERLERSPKKAETRKHLPLQKNDSLFFRDHELVGVAPHNRAETIRNP
jgi:hypothetical protein